MVVDEEDGGAGVSIAGMTTTVIMHLYNGPNYQKREL